MSLENPKRDVLNVCPRCLGTNVECQTVGVLEPGPDTHNNASCVSCGWSGKVGELAIVPFTNPFGNGEGTVEEFGRDMLMAVVKECAEPLGRVLIRWGFLDGKKIDKRMFSAYLAAISKAAAVSVMETRSKADAS